MLYSNYYLREIKMADIDTFIKDARKKGLDDETIRQALAEQKWDKNLIELKLAGLTAPTPSNASADPKKHNGHTSLSPLMSALHHILLWFFTGSSTITIIGVIASLFGENVSIEALAAMIAVTLVTFIPYATLFITYLVKARKAPGLVPGKVWSIITICLHSIGAMIAAIVFVINIITTGETTVVVSSGLVFTLDTIVVTTYLFAAFSTPAIYMLRRVITIVYIPLLFILFSVLFGASALQLGPAQHDEKVRTTLVSSVQAIADYTRTNNKLPADSTQISIDSSIGYEKITDQTYQVCAAFETGKNQRTSYYYNNDQEDSYVSEYMFESGSGNQCFTFKSSHLASSEYLNR